MTADPMPAPNTPRKQPTMNNNPFKPIPQRPERWDAAWQRRRDPIAYAAVEKVSRRGC